MAHYESTLNIYSTSVISPRGDLRSAIWICRWVHNLGKIDGWIASIG